MEPYQVGFIFTKLDEELFQDELKMIRPTFWQVCDVDKDGSTLVCKQLQRKFQIKNHPEYIMGLAAYYWPIREDNKQDKDDQDDSYPCSDLPEQISHTPVRITFKDIESNYSLWEDDPIVIDY